MPRKAKIITDFGSEPNPIFSDIVTVSCKSITANIGTFTGLPHTTSSILGLLDTFNDIRTKPVYDSQTADTNAARLLVDIPFTANCVWINSLALGDLSILKKSGVALQKDAEAQPQLPQTILMLNNTIKPGEIEYHISHLAFNAIKYGIMLTLESNPDNNPANWTFFYCGGVRHGIIPGLLSKTNYKMVSFGMGTDKVLTFSEPIICAAN